MTVQTTPITLDDLTTATVEGSGVFDVLMRANKAHLEQEFKLNRIKGTDYSTVYLGSLQAVLSAAMQFTLSREKQNLDALLQAKQIEITELTKVKLQAEIDQTYAQTNLVEQQQINLEDELETAILQRGKLSKDIEATEAQISQIITQSQLTAQQKLNMMDELLTTAKQRLKLDEDILATKAQVLQVEAQIDLTEQQIASAQDDLLTAAKQREKLSKDIEATDAQVLQVQQQTANLTAEAANIPKQGMLLEAQKEVQVQQVSNLLSEKARTDNQTAQIGAETKLVEQRFVGRKQ